MEEKKREEIFFRKKFFVYLYPWTLRLVGFFSLCWTPRPDASVRKGKRTKGTKRTKSTISSSIERQD